MWILGKEVQWNLEGEYYIESGFFTGIVTKNRIPENLPKEQAYTWTLMIGRHLIMDAGYTTGPGPAVDVLNARARQILHETEQIKA